MYRQAAIEAKIMNEIKSPTFNTNLERDLAMELCREIAADAEIVDLSDDVDLESEAVN